MNTFWPKCTRKGSLNPSFTRCSPGLPAAAGRSRSGVRRTREQVEPWSCPARGAATYRACWGRPGMLEPGVARRGACAQPAGQAVWARWSAPPGPCCQRRDGFVGIQARTLFAPPQTICPDPDGWVIVFAGRGVAERATGSATSSCCERWRRGSAQPNARCVQERADPALPPPVQGIRVVGATRALWRRARTNKINPLPMRFCGQMAGTCALARKRGPAHVKHNGIAGCCQCHTSPAWLSCELVTSLTPIRQGAASQSPSEHHVGPVSAAAHLDREHTGSEAGAHGRRQTCRRRRCPSCRDTRSRCR